MSGGGPEVALCSGSSSAHQNSGRFHCATHSGGRDRHCPGVSWSIHKKITEKVGLKLNIQKTKIMAFNPITSWQIDGETMETVGETV